MQIAAVVPPAELRAFDVYNPAVPELKFTPGVLLTLIPQLYWEKMEADIICDKPTLGYPTGLGVSRPQLCMLAPLYKAFTIALLKHRSARGKIV